MTPGDLVNADERLDKAYPPGGEKAGVLRPEVGVPGARGGQWHRDKHGHVRYDKEDPTAANKDVGNKPERDWSEVPEDKVQELSKTIEAAYSYSPAVRDRLCSYLGEWGYTPEDFLAVVQGAKVYGEPTERYFVDTAVLGGKSEQDAATAFGRIVTVLQDIMSDPEMVEGFTAAMAARGHAEKAFLHDLATTGYAKGFITEVLTGDVSPVALKLLGLMSDIRLLYIPHTVSEIGGNRTEAYEKIGRIVTNKVNREIMNGRADVLNPEHLVSLFVANQVALAERNRDFISDSSSVFASPNFGSQQLNIVHFVKQALEKTLGRPMSDPEATKLVGRLCEVGAKIGEYLSSFNSDTGGEAVGLIFGGAYAPVSLFSSDDGVHKIEEMVLAKKRLIKDALAAQQSDNFPTPVVMQPGFAALTEVMHQRGELDPDKSADLAKHQRKLLNWMKTIKRGIVAYDMGTGKTPSAIAFVAWAMQEGLDERGLIVLPKGLVRQWPDQIRAFYPGASVQHVGETASLEDRIDLLRAVQAGHLPADFLVMSSSTLGLSKHSRAALQKTRVVEELADSIGKLRWTRRKGVPDDEYIAALRDVAHTDPLVSALRDLKGTVIFDEAHHESQGLKEPTNIHNIVAGKMLVNRPYAFMLSGTPIPNGKPADLFHLMDLIHPGSAGPDVVRFSNKVARYEPVFDEKSGKVLMQQVSADDWGQTSKDIAPFVFFKKRTDPEVVASNNEAGLRFPGHRVHAHSLSVPNELRDLFKSAGNIKPHYVNDMQWTPSEKLSLVGSVLRTINQMQQLSITPKLLLGDTYTGPQPKIEHVRRLVQQHFNEGGNANKPVIVSSNWPGAFKYLKEELVKHGVDPSLIGVIDGTVRPEDRDVMQEAVNSGKVKVLLLGMQAGGTGLNLQKAANKLILMDQPWAPHHKAQVIGRVDRPGRAASEPIDVIDIRMVGSIDDQKLMSLRDKLSTIETLSYAKDGGEVASQAVMAAIIDLLGGLKSLETKDNAQIEQDLATYGLSGMITPEVLRGKFDVTKFGDTVEYKRYLRFEHNEIAAKRALLVAKHRNGTITKEKFASQNKHLDKLEHKWVRVAKFAKDVPVAVPERKIVQPEPHYTVVSENPPTGPGVDKFAVDVFNHIKDHKGAITVTDFMDHYYRPALDLQAKDDAEREQVGVDWWKYYSDIEHGVKDAFKTLRKVGVLAPFTSDPSKSKFPGEAKVEAPEIHPSAGPSTSAAE